MDFGVRSLIAKGGRRSLNIRMVLVAVLTRPSTRVNDVHDALYMETHMVLIVLVACRHVSM